MKIDIENTIYTVDTTNKFNKQLKKYLSKVRI